MGDTWGARNVPHGMRKKVAKTKGADRGNGATATGRIRTSTINVVFGFDIIFWLRLECAPSCRYFPIPHPSPLAVCKLS